jgi:ubiquinone/menaquinone biosynthesis C-methylase UbiE
MQYQNPEENERKFFFALNESELYDATIQLTVPLYDLIHKTLIDILNHHFNYTFGLEKNMMKGVFLDVGAGTGKESLSVLKEFPHLKVVAVDLAAPMKNEFTENYLKTFGSENERFTFIVSDILDLDFDKNSNELIKFNGEKRVGAFSAYCLHHLTLEKKQEAYQKMYDFLEPGGILVNIDLFNYQSTSLSQFAHQFDIEFIDKQFENPNEEFVESRKLPLNLRRELKEKWIEHMNKDNILDPVEFHLEILKEIGFKNVECPFRYFQQGIIIGVK